MEFDYIIICAGSAGWVLANWITSVEVNKVLFLKFEPKKILCISVYNPSLKHFYNEIILNPSGQWLSSVQ